MLPIDIRAERPDDVAAIDTLVRESYAAVPWSDGGEARMVSCLRQSDGFVPQLSLVASRGAVAVGHLLLTRAAVVGVTAFPVLALAPLSVLPSAQKSGVGRALVEAAHVEAASLGYGAIIVVGIPGYYERFGYEPLSRYPITLPFVAPERNRLVRALAPGALETMRGCVRYAEGWLDH